MVPTLTKINMRFQLEVKKNCVYCVNEMCGNALQLFIDIAGDAVRLRAAH